MTTDTAPGEQIDDHVFEFPPQVDPGTYRATFAGAREFTFSDKATGEDVTLVSWAFVVEGVAVEGVTSLLLSPRSKGFAWLRALAPDVVTARTSIPASDLIGRPALVVVEDREGEARVSDVLPAMK